MQTEIKFVYEHYEVFINGKFYCSADNYSEAVKEINNTKLIAE